MSLFQQEAVSDGTLLELGVTLDYLTRDSITVYFDGVEVALDSGWSWVGATSSFIEFSPAVADGVTVIVRRTTDIDAPIHVYNSGAMFRKVTLDESFAQILYYAQEFAATAGDLESAFMPLPSSATPSTGDNLTGSRSDHVHLAQTASTVAFTPTGAVAASTVQAAIAEVSADNAADTATLLAADAALTAAEALKATSTTLASSSGAGLLGFLYAAVYSAGTIGKWVQDLVLGAGSTFIGFIQDGTGAVTRTLQAKGREFKTPQDFGAVGDGITDDSAAMASWLLHKNLLLPPGTYLVSGILTAISGTRIFGIGNPVIKKVSADAIGSYTVLFLSNKDDILIDGVTFDGNGSAQTNTGSGKAVVEMWNGSKRLTMANCTVKNGYKWNILSKGNTTDGIPQNLKFSNINTSGALGYLSGVAAADGESGFVVVAGDVKVTNSQFEDRVDLEATTSLQIIHAMFDGCSFFKQLDSGAGAQGIGTIAVSNSTFYSTVGIICARVYGGSFTNNVFTNAYQGVTMAGDWYGIVALGNNNYGLHVSDCTFQGPLIGIGAVSPSNIHISHNRVDCSATALGSITEDSQTIPHGGVVFSNAGTVRGSSITSNTVNVTDAFNTAGGFGIQSASTDVRGITFVGNSVRNTSYGQGKAYVAVSRSFSGAITGNAATVTTNLSGANFVDTYESARFILTGADRVTAPAGGTFTNGDRAFISNPRSIASPTEAYAGWVYTTDAGWKRYGATT